MTSDGPLAWGLCEGLVPHHMLQNVNIEPQTWIDYVARPKLWKTDMRLIGVYEIRCNEGGSESTDYIFKHSLRSRKMNALCGDHVYPSTHDVFVRFLWNSMYRPLQKEFHKKWFSDTHTCSVTEFPPILSIFLDPCGWSLTKKTSP